jgi:hypothetical protein
MSFWWPGLMTTSADSRPTIVHLFRDSTGELDKFVLRVTSRFIIESLFGASAT